MNTAAHTAAPVPGARLAGIIFDCDGVLFDSKGANSAYYNHIRAAVALPPMSEEEASYAHMVSTDEALERMIPENLLEQAIAARNATRFRDLFMSLMEPSPHMTDFLRAMQARKMPMALCTNRSDSVHHVLAHFGLQDFFSPVMTISHAKPKPDPEGLFKILSAWGAEPGAVAFLGDSLVDCRAAAAAGVPFWCFGTTAIPAALHVNSFAELGALFDRFFTRQGLPSA